ncbi:PUM-HD domain-containing protein [Mycena indigotica]|uniref:PUM-HD domain-containing protein n=1 Tax=Mycena indigotica TaxID=2126181 RepID=A0A8H6VU82_9AGAR|nr:PUM-HD domain-containing protein [Mycena indigotica]KAF7290268.1 PUM-HD domain-containing protein [Mycena indigotica]
MGLLLIHLAVMSCNNVSVTFLNHTPGHFSMNLQVIPLILCKINLGTISSSSFWKTDCLATDRPFLLSFGGRVLAMACHKFASNVCEKAMIFGDSDGRKAIIEELMGPALRPDGLTPIGLLMKDQYGNYVLQRALAVAEGEQKEALTNAIRPQLATMRKHAAYSKHLASSAIFFHFSSF